MSGNSNWFSGNLSTAAGPAPGGTYEGISAGISNRYAAICDSGSHNPESAFNFTWVMVAQNISAGSYRGYAQAGYFRGWAWSGPCFTYEFKKNASDTFHRFHRCDLGIPAYDTGSTFTVGWGTNQFWFSVDSTNLGNSGWDPYATDAFWPYGTGPMQTQANAETTYTGSDIPGTAGAPIWFVINAVQTWNGHAWTASLPPYGGTLPAHPRSAHTAVSGGVFTAWGT